jgi:hypothetical protein
MEQALPGVAVLVGEEALVWEDRGEEEWGEPERVQDPEENACARNAERLLHMKAGFPVTLRNAPNAVHRW